MVCPFIKRNERPNDHSGSRTSPDCPYVLGGRAGRGLLFPGVCDSRGAVKLPLAPWVDNDNAYGGCCWKRRTTSGSLSETRNVWLAKGQYHGKTITVQDDSEIGAITRWSGAAHYLHLRPRRSRRQVTHSISGLRLARCSPVVDGSEDGGLLRAPSERLTKD